MAPTLNTWSRRKNQTGNRIIPEHVLIGQKPAHTSSKAQAVRGAAVECPGEAGLVTRLIPQLSAELGAVLPTAHTRLKQGICHGGYN